MNDSYKELLVSKRTGVKDKLIRVVSIIPTVLAGLLALLTGNILIFIIAVAFGVLVILFFSGHPSNMSICIWIKRLPLIRLWQRPEEKESLPLM